MVSCLSSSSPSGVTSSSSAARVSPAEVSKPRRKAFMESFSVWMLSSVRSLVSRIAASRPDWLRRR